MIDKSLKLITDDGTQTFTQVFSQMHGGQVLDIATGPGGFIGVLKQFLKSYDKITGIDVRQDLLDKAEEAFPEEQIVFELMDASEMTFPDGYFDLVCCAFSLHHLIDIASVIDEIKRVLKPDGVVVFVEMYKDHQTETQLTEVSVHHFGADSDMVRGINHNHTFNRYEIIEMLENQFLLIDVYDFADLTLDPKDPEMREAIENVIGIVTERTKELPEFPKFVKKGDALKQRLAEIGTHPASRLVLVAKK
jgi:ubiquinone/menaquinone biosynthesis C-methylase UbiE